MDQDQVHTSDLEDAEAHSNGIPKYTGGQRPRFSPEIEAMFDEVTDKQGAFCLYYALGSEETIGNGTQSALRAGYSEKSATQQASYLLSTPKIKRLVRALRRVAQQIAQISFQDYVGLLLQQANSWLDTDGQPKELPMVSHGEVVHAEFLLRDENGNVLLDEEKNPVTMRRPIIEQWRPNASNTKAAELLGKALGYLDAGQGPKDGLALGMGGRNNQDALPDSGYDELPDGSLATFLENLPDPSALSGGS